jgi:hypothetical protein
MQAQPTVAAAESEPLTLFGFRNGQYGFFTVARSHPDIEALVALDRSADPATETPAAPAKINSVKAVKRAKKPSPYKAPAASRKAAARLPPAPSPALALPVTAAEHDVRQAALDVVPSAWWTGPYDVEVDPVAGDPRSLPASPLAPVSLAELAAHLGVQPPPRTPAVFDFQGTNAWNYLLC